MQSQFYWLGPLNLVGRTNRIRQHSDGEPPLFGSVRSFEARCVEAQMLHAFCFSMPGFRF